MTQLDLTAERVAAFADELSAPGTDQLDLSRALVTEGMARLIAIYGRLNAAEIVAGMALALSRESN